MIDLGEKQIAIKLGEKYISHLDDLARLGHTNRRQLMANFIKVWLDELKESNSANFFHLAIILRGVEAEFESDPGRRSEFVELNIPEKPFPIMLMEDDSLYIVSSAGRCNMTRHLMMKNMVITGIEELEALTNNREYDFSVVEPKLKKAFGIIMAKGARAFIKGIQAKHPFKRDNYE